jgi:hypothetical protein
MTDTEPYNPMYDTCERCEALGDLCEECEERPFVLSPTGRALIEGGADWVSDHTRMEADEVEQGETFSELIWLGDWLPAVFSRHYTPEFVRRFGLAVEAVRVKLTDPEPYLACTAEELAAHAILDQAADWAEDWDEEGKAKFGIVDEPRGRADVQWLKDVAFEDHDVLLLFDPSMDGIEESELAPQMGFANLAAPDWFKPFRSDDDGEGDLHQLPESAPR